MVCNIMQSLNTTNISTIGYLQVSSVVTGTQMQVWMTQWTIKEYGQMTVSAGGQQPDQTVAVG